MSGSKEIKMTTNKKNQENNVEEIIKSLRKKIEEDEISQNEYFFHVAEALRLLAGQTELNWKEPTGNEPGDDSFVEIIRQYGEKEMAELYIYDRVEFRNRGVKGMDEHYNKYWGLNSEKLSEVQKQMWDVVLKDISPELLSEVDNLPNEKRKQVEADCNRYIQGLMHAADTLQSVWDFLWQDEVDMRNSVVAAILKMKLANYDTIDSNELMMKMAILAYIYSTSPRNHETQEDEYWGYDEGW